MRSWEAWICSETELWILLFYSVDSISLPQTPTDSQRMRADLIYALKKILNIRKLFCPTVWSSGYLETRKESLRTKAGAAALEPVQRLWRSLLQVVRIKSTTYFSTHSTAGCLTAVLVCFCSSQQQQTFTEQQDDEEKHHHHSNSLVEADGRFNLPHSDEGRYSECPLSLHALCFLIWGQTWILIICLLPSRL